MAWLVKEKSGIFHLAFRFAGEESKRTLKTRDVKTARAMLHRLEENIRLVEVGRVVVPDEADLASFLLSDGRVTKSQPTPRQLTVGELFERYRESLPDNSLSPESLRVAQIHLRHIVRIIGQRKKLCAVEFSDLQNYVKQRARETGKRGNPVSTGTIKKELSSFQTLWNWARRAGLLGAEYPREKLQYPIQRSKPPFQTWQQIQRRIARGQLTAAEQAELWDCLYLNTTEINELLDFIEDRSIYGFLHPMCVMAAHTGARRSELCRSRVDDFDLEQGLLLIREKKRVRGKETSRHVPLTGKLREVMSAWLSARHDSIYTFPEEHRVSRTRNANRRENTHSVSPDEATDHLDQVLSGSKWTNVRGWHLFRHSFISNCASLGVDQRMIDSWVGHQTDAMRKRYRHLFPTLQQQALAKVFD